jgi:hypothetical protein
VIVEVYRRLLSRSWSFENNRYFGPATGVPIGIETDEDFQMMAARSTAQSTPMNHSSQVRPDTPDAATEMPPRTLAGINLRLTPVPPQQRPVEDSGYDSQLSGYDSQLLTPEELTPVALSSRKLFQRKPTPLKPFDKEIPEATRHRFNDLKELFDEPIFQYLTLNRPKCQINHYSISMKLMVLGENEASAKPWVVVLCDKSIYKYVKRYFNRPLVRQEFQSRETEPDLPSLEVVVHNKPPRRIAATGPVEIFGETWGDVLPPTLCGTIIQARGPDFTRRSKSEMTSLSQTTLARKMWRNLKVKAERKKTSFSIVMKSS